MNSSIMYFPASALINGLASIFLAIFALLLARQKRIARYLAFFCLSVAAWSLSYFIWQFSTTAETALWWSRTLMLGAIIVPVAYIHLVLVFLGYDKQKGYKRLLLLFYGNALIWLLQIGSPHFVSHVEPRSYFKFWPVAGNFFGIFVITFIAEYLYASFLLLMNYRNSKVALARKQSLLMLIGILLAFLGGTTNYFLWFNIPIAPWGNGLVSLYILLTVYAILKYKFMEVKVVLVELFVSLVIIFLIADVALSHNLSEVLFRLTILLFISILAIISVRSVRKEIKHREDEARLLALEESNRKLQEIDRQKSEFLTIAAHQLRTPVSIINNYVGVLQDGDYGQLSKDVKQILSNIDQSNQWLVRLADDFLNISKLEQNEVKFNFAPIDLAKIIDKVVEELAAKAVASGLKLEWNRPSELGTVLADAEKIRVCVENMLDNAIKYGRLDGKIDDAALPTKGVSAIIKIRLAEDNGGIAFSVSDFGIGFDAEDRDRFFQKFSRGNNVKGLFVHLSTGLGLYICKKFIEGHKGKVWAKSCGPGRGSEFGFWLPLF